MNFPLPNFIKNLFLKPAATKIEDFIATEKDALAPKVIDALEKLNIQGLTPDMITQTVETTLTLLVTDIDAVIDGEVAAQTSN